jgi:magnesium chelatase subunit I
VGLFNILQEGDVQIKGYPVRLPLDLLMVFSANPEDYTARGKIITPLKDRIGSEIRTHYPATRQHAMQITRQEAWAERGGGAMDLQIPEYVREVVEEVAFQARQDQKIDKRSGVSQRLPISLLENVISNAERRALATAESAAVPRITDIYAAIPAITGKFELEYEGELKGADNVARELIRAAVANVYEGHFPNADLRQVTEWFDLGGTLQVDDTLSSSDLLSRTDGVQGLHDAARSICPRIPYSRPQSISCSRDSTHSGRSAGPSRDTSRPANSRNAPHATSTSLPSASCRCAGTRRSTTTSQSIL